MRRFVESLSEELYCCIADLEVSVQPNFSEHSKIVAHIDGRVAYFTHYEILDVLSKSRSYVTVTCATQVLKMLMENGIRKAVFALKDKKNGDVYAERVIKSRKFLSRPRVDRRFTQGIPSRAIRLEISSRFRKKYDHRRKLWNKKKK